MAAASNLQEFSLFAHIPDFLQELIQRELEPGEQVEWIGLPRQTVFGPGNVGAILFAIPWTGFALFWTAGAAGFQIPDFRETDNFFPLVGVPFILIGLAMFTAPFWTYLKVRQTVYLITDRRAISFEGIRAITIRSFPPEKLANVYRRERKDGSGDIVIPYRPWQPMMDDTQTPELGFMRIAEVHKVELLLKKLAEQASSQTTSTLVDSGQMSR